ncbi:MAG: ABC transporter permease [Chitinophagaceae bacterium]|nr:ABC transporter permease [Chitinophagaceae bacterium]
MKVSLFIANRIVRNRQPSFSGFIIRVAAIATGISVATMVVTLSLVNGFQHEVAQKVYDFWGHVRVQNLEPFRTLVAEETPVIRTPFTDSVVFHAPELQHAHAFAARSVVLRSRGQFEGVLLKGVESRFTTSPFARFLRAGRLIQFPDSGYSSEIMISSTLATRLNVSVNDTLSAFYLRQGEEIRTRRLVVAGLYKTGIEEYDNNFVITDLRFLQRLNMWTPNQIGGYEIWIQNKEDASRVSDQLSGLLPQGMAAAPISSIYPNIFDWLNIQDQTKKIVIGVMLAVAIINLVTCLLILVMERTTMIALLSALGMTPQGVRKVFWYYAAYIAGAGVAGGLLLGLGVVGLQHLTGWIRMDEATYYVDRMPVKVIWWQVLAIAFGSFTICVAALRLPLMVMKHISVVRALRFN